MLNGMVCDKVFEEIGARLDAVPVRDHLWKVRMTVVRKPTENELGFINGAMSTLGAVTGETWSKRMIEGPLDGTFTLVFVLVAVSRMEVIHA